MAAAIAEVCVDPRLNHELLRIQVRQKLGRLGLSAERIYVLNENGDTLGSNFRNTVRLLRLRGEALVLCAVLHHDDCLAAQAGLRLGLDESAQRVAAYLAEQGVPCPVLTGEVRTENNHLRWTDEPARGYEPFSFGGY
ncbi:MAG TPA: hypothetical protein VG370_31155 [Chloroflexota bacterium]|jgi:hypothetical protein|nr:hypothetical protein [Chloroflexota bacterium]